jgi:hypothetical protein
MTQVHRIYIKKKHLTRKRKKEQEDRESRKHIFIQVCICGKTLKHEVFMIPNKQRKSAEPIQTDQL